ncbi:MAG TPA: hypothetical protein VE075_00710 [Thermoanaerobaculia bacterium]|nr:hypothetical protein [Thermoanaerobaculia bacterium]
MRRPSMLAMMALTGAVVGSACGNFALAAAAPKDEPRSPLPVLEQAPPGTVVFDDDGGRVQIVPRRAVPPSAASYHGGPVITGGTVQAIFLGSAWRDEGPRGREAQALEALAGRGGVAIGAALSRFGLEARELVGLAQEDPLDPLGGASVSDLEIQARIDGMVSGGAHGPLDLHAVYVVFLAPGLRSTLGVTDSEQDFAAYHNHYHAAAGVVRYVVVPYDRELSRWLENARQSLVQALVNPEGNGWY